MRNILRNIYRTAQQRLTYTMMFPKTYISYIKRTTKKYTNKEGAYAIVNMDKTFKYDDHGRYFYIVCMYLNYSGYNVVVKINCSDLYNPLRYKKYLLQQDYTFVRKSSAPVNTIVLVQPNTINHIIHFSYGHHFLNSTGFDCVAPYPLHPYQYKFYLSPTFAIEAKKSTRTIKILFAGSANEKLYKSENIERHFKHLNIISRLKVLEFILSNFEKCRVFQGDQDRAALISLVYSENYSNEIIISKVKTKVEDWLKILSKSDFFICPPGQGMPWSHNSVEAMSAGAIPIIQYSELFTPHLENYKNCLHYTNYAELKLAIERAFSMNSSEIENMRKNVLTYFNDYLSIDSIAKRIKKFSSSEQRELKVAIPYMRSEAERQEKEIEI